MKFITLCLLSFLFSFPLLSQVSHQTWDDLLKKHVTTDGKVNYKGFIQDTEKLNLYLKTLSDNSPKDSWSREQQLAYWINAYNAFTVKLITDNYPLKSIQDLHPTIKIPGVSTVWHKTFFQIGGEDESLNDIEHKILRKKFDEPRIHFAINCASFSCPNLRNEAFTPNNLEQQLNAQAKAFINDPSKNKLGASRIELSKIFSWFKKDFTQKVDLIAFLNQYADKKINDDADIDYMDYNWNLNE